MDSCRLPIETCEKIMDNVQTLPRPAFGYNTFPYDQLSGPLVTMQANLGACALTCRAWSVHARFLLRQYVVLLPQTLERFLTTIRVQPECADSVTFLCLTRRWRGAGLLAGSDITPFLLRSFPKLRHIILEDVDVSGSLTAENRERHKMHPKLLRMRPPMLAHLTELVLHNCNFSLDRTFCDLIWACLQLRSLIVINCTIGPKDFPPAGRMLLPVAARKLKIAHVSLLGSNFLWQPPVGVFLGASVTSLKIGYIFDILGSGLREEAHALRLRHLPKFARAFRLF
ncbi:hypothetical protein BC628DRAFT_1051934 [Trametes gibbosa]|nr:hypothetical protein BC628DRAFT_1051934 [Trametes gibbosa]